MFLVWIVEIDLNLESARRNCLGEGMTTNNDLILVFESKFAYVLGVFKIDLVFVCEST